MKLATWIRILRLMLVLGALGWIGAAPAGAAGASGNWQVVLAAGDDAEPVFDNATHEMSRRLAAAGVPPGNIHRLSASASEIAAGAEPATAEVLLRRIADLPARPGEQCLIFLTSHGERGSGVWLARSNRALTPDEPRPRIVARLQRGAHGRHRLGLLQRQLCSRQNGETQSRRPDRRPRRPAILRLPGSPHLQLL